MDNVQSAKVKVFGFLLGRKEFELNRYGCFNGRDGQGNQIRYNAQDEKVLKFEKKIPVSSEEKKQQPLKNTKWITIESQGYEKVKIVEGKLVLKENAPLVAKKEEVPKK